MKYEEEMSRAKPGSVWVPEEMARRFPDGYCRGAVSDCMQPSIYEGDVLFISPSAPLIVRGLVFLSGLDGDYCKRLLFLPKPGVIGRPTPAGHGISTVTVQMDNPKRVFHFRADRLRLVHAVVGISRHGAEPMRYLVAEAPTQAAAMPRMSLSPS